MQVQFFNDSLELFIARLNAQTIAKVVRTIELLKEYGHQLKLPHSKYVARGIFELRITGRQEVRLLYAFNKEKIIVLHGFVKKSRRLPPKEIHTAERRLKTLDGI